LGSIPAPSALIRLRVWTKLPGCASPIRPRYLRTRVRDHRWAGFRHAAAGELPQLRIRRLADPAGRPPAPARARRPAHLRFHHLPDRLLNERPREVFSPTFAVFDSCFWRNLFSVNLYLFSTPHRNHL
jgi:hypothetical protein